MMFRQPTVDNYGIYAEHDMACPVCSSRGAILHLNDGTFHPCDLCFADGWVLIRQGRIARAITRRRGRR
jgi:hypothetical protein